MKKVTHSKGWFDAKRRKNISDYMKLKNKLKKRRSDGNTDKTQNRSQEIQKQQQQQKTS